MRFFVRVREVGTSRTWSETVDDASLGTFEACQEWAQGIITRFNNSLRPAEKPRELIEVIMIGPSVIPLQHDWKKSNLVTIIEDNSRPYDTYRCERCGATGKRYGLDARIVTDPGQPHECHI